MPLLIAVAALAGLIFLPSQLAYGRASHRLAAALAEADSAESRLAAVGYLGTTVERADGTWIAIAYSDSHAMPGAYSCAVARCSDGSWFECSYHFCGALAYFTKSWPMELSMYDEDPAKREEFRREQLAGNPVLNCLELTRVAPTLVGAKQKLLEFGFERRHAP